MTGWDRDFKENKIHYMNLFEKSMQKEQEANVEFLEEKLKLHTGRKYVVACSNGTDALHFALRSLGIRKGDEVLVSQFSWISSASCVSMVGATPVFCEIDILSYHMTLDSIKRMYSDKVRAIVYPHLFGNMSEYDSNGTCKDLPNNNDLKPVQSIYKSALCLPFKDSTPLSFISTVFTSSNM